jgi:hypothetical protein
VQSPLEQVPPARNQHVKAQKRPFSTGFGVAWIFGRSETLVEAKE